MDHFRLTLAQINLKNLIHNLDCISQIAGPNRFICPMVKANAYGHGAVEIAKNILKNYNYPVGVALVEEALQLRQAGINSEIIVFGGFNQFSLPSIEQAHLTIVVSQFEQLELIEKYCTTDVKIHLKFNTGMNRLGFKINQTSQLKAYLKSHLKIKPVGILTHFHSSQLLNYVDSTAHKQLMEFDAICSELSDFNLIPHAFNSDAISLSSDLLKNQSSLFLKRNWGFRPGIMMYGYLGSEVIKNKLNLKPVMSLSSHISAIQKIKKGESVSYNATWKAEKESVIGIVEIGYADGIHRVLSNKGLVYIDEMPVPIVGNICMDFLMIDLTDLEKADLMLNKEVFFFGEHFGADKFAERAGTISYEILTSIANRIPRIYKEN